MERGRRSMKFEYNETGSMPCLLFITAVYDLWQRLPCHDMILVVTKSLLNLLLWVLTRLPHRLRDRRYRRELKLYFYPSAPLPTRLVSLFMSVFPAYKYHKRRNFLRFLSGRMHGIYAPRAEPYSKYGRRSCSLKIMQTRSSLNPHISLTPEVSHWLRCFRVFSEVSKHVGFV